MAPLAATFDLSEFRAYRLVIIRVSFQFQTDMEMRCLSRIVNNPPLRQTSSRRGQISSESNNPSVVSGNVEFTIIYAGSEIRHRADQIIATLRTFAATRAS